MCALGSLTCYMNTIINLKSCEIGPVIIIIKYAINKTKIKAFLKRRVFKCTLKESMFLQFLRLDGKAFHTVGPAWEKTRSSKVFRVTLGITSNVS